MCESCLSGSVWTLVWFFCCVKPNEAQQHKPESGDDSCYKQSTSPWREFITSWKDNYLKWHLLNIIYIFHNISGESCVLIYADKFQSSKVKLRYVAPEKLRMWSDFIFILTSETRWSAERDESLHQWLFLFSFCKTKDRKWTLRKCKRWTNELKIITDVWSKNTAGWQSLVRVDL